SLAPIRPSSPYETRSPSSTCAGSPEPSRPATYFTSGAYVRMSRSRIALSPLLTRYSRQRDLVSSASATRKRIRGVSALPQSFVGQRGEPEGECHGGEPNRPAGTLVARAVDGGERDAEKADREQREQGAQCASLLQD